ncbi:MAG: serine hydrolase [Bacteroidales bacterium]|nr:serine hydrolase [Bacteroidales bacterium]
MKMKISFTATLLITGMLLNAQTSVPAFITDSLDSYTEQALAEWQIPGVAVLVVKDGQVIVQKGYGFLESGKPEQVDENTLFMIASNTKAFTGTAMAILEQEGKCSLDDRVQKYLPGFKMKDPWVAEHITLTDVMSHRIGMETFQGDFMYWESDLSSDEVIEKFGMLTPMYDFRAKWGYCNAGFLIAGKCLEQITGMTWEQFMRDRIVNPLEMKRTLVMTAEIANAENLAAAHTLVNGKLQVIPHCQVDNIAPAASISSSVSDMSHWIIAQLDSGRYNGRQVIPWQAIRKAQYPNSIVRRARHPFNITHYSLYGMGWSLQDYEGREMVSHTGGVDGFVTSVTLIPEEKLGVVVFTNTDMNGLYEAVKWEIIDAYLGLPYRNYSQVFISRYMPAYKKEMEMITSWQDSAKMNLPMPVKLAKFAGKYNHEVYGSAILESKGDYLLLKLEHHPDLTSRLEYIGNNRFLCTYSSPLWGIKVFPFVIKDGKVISFTLSVADFLEFTTYEFVKE